MYLRIAFTILVLAAGLKPSGAQQKFLKPDFKSIENIVKDKNSVFYYPHLIKRYKENDTTLSDKDYFMLYYGYFFNDDSSSSAFAELSEVNDSIRALRSRELSSMEDWKKLIHYSEQFLEQSPFSLETLYMLYVGYQKTGAAGKSRMYEHKLAGIVRAILSTGDGATEESGYFVLQVADEYAMISLLGFEYGGQQSLTAQQCDYLTLKDNESHVKGIYFDVKQLFKGYEKMFKAKD